MDAASNTGVDNIREIIESARYKPMTARTKVFIIDEVHMLSKGAFNALLKTLEEPPGHVKFIFATTEVRKVPVTVLSRCQRFDLRRVDVPRLAKHLTNIVRNEGAEADEDAILMIARAAEGSVRDSLSILDQAIATSIGAAGKGHVTADVVRGMLGLADKGRIFDLLGELAGGNAAAALTSLTALFHAGADAVQVLSDLADAVHTTARIKTIGMEAAGDELSAEEKRRAKAFGDSLSMALLSRYWQMLLKGIEETSRAPNPLAAAEMVLIRIAFTPDLPPPDEIIRALGGAGAIARKAGSPAADARRGAERAEATADDDSAPPRAEAPSSPPPAARAPQASADTNSPFPFEPFDGELAMDEAYDGVGEAGDDEDERPSAAGTFLRPLNSFDDVVALVGEKRDMKLRVALEDKVSLVRFDGAAGAIDLYLMPGAQAELANELREKLNKWTQRRWMVMLSKKPGEPPIGQVRREREAAEREALSKHPAVRAVLDAFPGAKVGEIREAPRDRRDDTASG